MESHDSLEIEQLEQTVRSEGYALIVRYLKRIHDAKLRELRNRDLTHEQTQHLRGMLDGIDRALGVPDQIRAEEPRRGKR